MNDNDPALPRPSDIPSLLQPGQAALAVDPAQIPWQDRGGLPWPDYPPPLRDFFAAASEAPWADRHYAPAACADQVRSGDGIEPADLARLRSLRTWMARGERFCDGHRAAMLSHGHLRRCCTGCRSWPDTVGVVCRPAPAARGSGRIPPDLFLSLRRPGAR